VTSRIPDTDHVARYCSPARVDDEGVVQASAFLLRRGEDYLSVNWLEFLDRPTRNGEIEEIRRVYGRKSFRVKPRARFAVLNVGKIRQTVRDGTEDNRILDACHNPSSNDPSHSGIYNIGADHELIAELILESGIETHQACP